MFSNLFLRLHLMIMTAESGSGLCHAHKVAALVCIISWLHFCVEGRTEVRQRSVIINNFQVFSYFEHTLNILSLWS